MPVFEAGASVPVEEVGKEGLLPAIDIVQTKVEHNGDVVPSALLPVDRRSTSPAVPLSATASASANRPKISFRASIPPTVKPEPTEENGVFATPLAPVSQPSESPRESAEPSAKPKPKIRLSLGALSNGHGSDQGARPSGVVTAEPQTIYTPTAGPSNGYRATSVQSNGDSSQMPVNVKKMQALIMKLFRMDESMFFRRPVDPILDGCPTWVVA